MTTPTLIDFLSCLQLSILTFGCRVRINRMNINMRPATLIITATAQKCGTRYWNTHGEGWAWCGKRINSHQLYQHSGVNCLTFFPAKVSKLRIELLWSDALKFNFVIFGNILCLKFRTTQFFKLSLSINICAYNCISSWMSSSNYFHSRLCTLFIYLWKIISMFLVVVAVSRL